LGQRAACDSQAAGKPKAGRIDRLISLSGDRLDLICWKHYGSLSGRVVEIVLDANPGMAMTLTLSAGQIVNLPAIEPIPREQSLW
jgi:phage tail protein X